MEEFDIQIERYLRHQMSEAEESAFVEELKVNKSLRLQAKQVALLIKSLSAQNSDKEIIADVFSSNLDSLVDDYIRHKMTVEQERTFKEVISENKELREKVRATALLIKQVSNDSAETEDIIEDVKKSPRTTFTLFSTRWIGYAAMVAVVISIGFGGFRIKRSHDLEQLATELYSEYDKSEVLGRYRGGDKRDFDECKFTMAKLKEDVESGKDIQSSLTRLSLLYKEVSGDSYTEYMDYKSDITRLYVMALLKNGDKKETINLLEKIIKEEPDAPDATWAVKVKARIEDIW